MLGSERLTQKQILLVDDQREVRETVKLLLSLDGHKVVEATNGQQALELFQKGTFDLVITDYAMPGMLGDALAKRVKQLRLNQRVLMVTGSIEASSLEAGCVDGLLNKPFNLEDLRQAVGLVLQPLAA